MGSLRRGLTKVPKEVVLLSESAPPAAMNSETSATCRRCEAALPEGAVYCPACGVGVVAAHTGEYDVYDVDRFFNYALDMLCIAGIDGYFKRVNPAFEKTLGWTAEELLAKPFVELIHPEDRSETVAEIGSLAGGAPTLSFENRFRCKDGTYLDFQWTSHPEPGTGLLYAVARDVTRWKRGQDRVDLLTGLASRRLFDEAFVREWSRAYRLKVGFGLIVFDVDGFQNFNERYGFDAGDRVLAKVGAILCDHSRRAGDLAARIGGQSFGFLLHGGFTQSAAEAMAEVIRKEMAALGIKHEGLPGKRLTIRAGALGVVPSDESSTSRALAAVKAAVKKAKEKGGNCVISAAEFLGTG